VTPLQQPHGSHGCQYPLKLADLRHVALQINCALGGIQSQCHIVRSRAARQVPEALAIADRRQRMVIRQKVIAGMTAFRKLYELLNGAEVVAKMEVTRWLNPGNNNHFIGCIGHRLTFGK